jgi:hypothetical protein
MKIETDMRNLFFRLLWGCDLDSLWQAEGGLVSHRLFSLPAAQLISHLGQTKTKTRKKKKPREPGRKIYIRARKEEKSEKKKNLVWCCCLDESLQSWLERSSLASETWRESFRQYTESEWR